MRVFCSFKNETAPAVSYTHASDSSYHVLLMGSLGWLADTSDACLGPAMIACRHVQSTGKPKLSLSI